MTVIICSIVYPLVLFLYFAACKYQHVKVPEIPERIRVPLAFWINVVFGTIVGVLSSYAIFLIIRLLIYG